MGLILGGSWQPRGHWGRALLREAGSPWELRQGLDPKVVLLGWERATPSSHPPACGGTMLPSPPPALLWLPGFSLLPCKASARVHVQVCTCVCNDMGEGVGV